MENKINDLKYLEEFELVDNSKYEIYNDKESMTEGNKSKEYTENKKTYIQKNVYIKPIYKSATSIEYKVYYADENNNLEEIGTVKSDNQIVLTAKYKDRKRMEIDVNEFDFDSEKIEVDIQKMIEKQRLRDEQRKKKDEKNEDKYDESNLEKKENNQQEDKDEERNNKEDGKDKENNEKEDLISDENLKEQGYNITSYTRIKGQHVIDLMIVQGFNPRSVIVTEIDGQPVFLAKENGTRKIIELPTKIQDNSIEEVNEFENNVERTRGTGKKVTLINCPGVVFDVSKNNKNQIGVLADIDKDGKRERFNVGELVHPTDQEYEMQRYMKAGYNFAPSNPLMTDEMISSFLEKMPKEEVSEVQSIINGMSQNPTKDEFDEIVENVKNKKEKEKENENNEHYTERYLGDKYEVHP